MFVHVRRVWRSGREIAHALRLVEAGLRDSDVAGRTGIPLETVRAWRRGRVPERARRVLDGVPQCDRCGEVAHEYERLPVDDYAYLLGLYLGDGCVASTPKGGHSLRISLDAAYPGIIRSARESIAAVKDGPLPHVGPHGASACVVITSYWKVWPCLLPQHGPGRKHTRRITLEQWQDDIVAAAPKPFLRALIHTDGWRGTNAVRAKGRDYAYPRYQFSNRSDDIRRLFTDACDRLGVAWRPWGPFHISVARREAVATLDAFIGPKA
jgi:hypothetical protein